MSGHYAMPMRLLRQYLMPESAQADHPPLTPDALRAWIAALPLNRPLEAAGAIADQAARVRRREANVRARIRLYDLLYDVAGQVLPQIEEKLGRASLPLSPQADALIEQANRLLKEFGHGYASIAAEVSGKWLGLGFAKPLRVATLRGLASHARRLMLAYRAYAGGSRSAWNSMHRLYRIARDGGFAVDQIDNGFTVEQIYLRALLMAFADPARLRAGELDRVRFYIERYGQLAVLGDPAGALTGKAASGGLFLVRQNTGNAGRSLVKWHDLKVQPDDLIVDCTALIGKVAEHVRGLEANIVPARLGLPLVARQPQYLAMLKSMMAGWGAPAMRRFHRARFHPRVDLAAGFEAAWRFLDGPAYRRRHNERGEPESPAGQVSEWAILNESASGFALRLVADGTMEVRVGELVAMRPHDRGTVQACLARRALSAKGSKLVMGLEALASRPLAITIALPDPQALRRGESGPMRQVRAILLLKLPSQKNAPALLAAHDEVWPGIEFTVTNRGRQTRLRVARRLEKTASAELYLLERGGT